MVQAKHARDLPVLIVCVGLADAELVDPEKIGTEMSGRQASSSQHRETEGVAWLSAFQR
jgi:hypothetical protein